MKKGVIFDLDNTLYNYDKCDKKAQQVLQDYCELTLHVSKEKFSVLYARAKEDVKRQLGNVGASHNRMLYMQRLLELINCKPISYALELYDVYWDTMLSEMTPFEYVIPFWERLSENNIKIGILTDLTVHIQHRKLRALGISDYVDAIVTSEEVGVEKPAPIMFERMIQKLGIVADELIMVGDSEEKDCEGARRCGIEAIHFQESCQENIVNEIVKMIKPELFMSI